MNHEEITLEEIERLNPCNNNDLLIDFYDELLGITYYSELILKVKLWIGRKTRYIKYHILRKLGLY